MNNWIIVFYKYYMRIKSQLYNINIIFEKGG
jgi:hypothetical protein